MLCAVATSLGAASAQAGDVTSAAEELKQGYILKLGGNCGEAIRHFVASYRLDPRPKAVLNLADCERQTGDLLAARGHATEGRELARRQNDAELVGVAEQQLATIDRRLARLTIRLSPGAPVGSVVARNGVNLDTSSLGVAAALNPGTYHIVATAPGHAQHQSDVTLGEGAREDIEVQPGPAVVDARPAAIPPTVPATIEPTEGSGTPSSGSTRTALTYGAFGVGAAGIVVGVAVGVAAGSKHSTLEGECTGNNCPSSAQSDIDSFRSLRTWSTVGYVVGFVGLAGGAVLLLTAPRAVSDTTAHVWIGPASAGLAGAF